MDSSAHLSPIQSTSKRRKYFGQQFIIKEVIPVDQKNDNQPVEPEWKKKK